MQLYHADCPESMYGRTRWWRRWQVWRPLFKGMSRMQRVNASDNDRIFHTMTFRCMQCQAQVHIDTDWPDEQGQMPLLDKEFSINFQITSGFAATADTRR